MSSFLRTARIFKSLRSIASSFHIAARPQRAICHVKPSPAVHARCFSVQPTFQVNRPVFHNELDNLLHKLDNDGQRFGIISVSLIHRILALVKKNSDISSSQALLVLRCFGTLMPEELPAARTELALDFWSTLESKGIPLDLSHHNALLRLYLENEHNFSPLDFLSRLQEKGLEPNRITYQRLVARFAQVGDIEGASKILEFMKEKNIAINETIFNSLIMGHARANDLSSAVDLLEVMRKSGLEPSVDTYSALAVAQAEKGDLDGIKSTIALSKENRQALHDRDLLEVVYALAVSGHKELIPEVLSMVQKDWGYNQDCRNLIFRLLNAGCDAEARQAYATMEGYAEQHSQSNFNRGFFYVKHLILRDRPASAVVGLCEELSGNSPHMLLKALEVAVLNNTNLVSPIMDALRSKGEVLRPHYFWPLLAQCSAKRDTQGLCAVLENMKSREVPYTTQTLVDYVLPCLLEVEGTGSSGLVQAILRLKDMGVQLRDAVNAVVKYSLIRDDLKSAVEILRQFVYTLSPQLRRPLVSALCNTGAYEEAAIVLMQIVRPRRAQQQEGGMDEEAAAFDEEVLAPLNEDNDIRRNEDDMVGRVLLDLAFKINSDKYSIDVAAFLRALHQRGLSINRQSEAAIAHRLGVLATPEVNTLLSTLASGKLSLVELERGSNREYYTSQSVSELEARLEKYLAEDKDTKQVLTNLLIAYTKTRNVEKSEETLQKLQDMQIPIGMGLKVLILDMYCSSKLTQKALDLFNDIYAREPDTFLMPSKCLKVARCLVEEGRVDEAIDAMNLWGKHGASDVATPDSQQDGEEADLDRASHQATNDNFIDMMCGIILLPLGDKGELETVQRLVDTILQNKLARPSRQLLAPIVNAHLAKDDVEGAMETLSRFAKNHKLLPSQQRVLCALIRREDTDKLRQLVDMGTEIFGEGNTLLDLAMAFIDEGRYNEARRIFETPGLRITQNRLNYICDSLVKQNKMQSLEALLRVTVPVFGVDRRILYQQALQAYITVGDCDNALGLWTQMQGEDVNITDQFLYTLGRFLRENDREVPFAIPADPSATQPSTATASPSDRKQHNLDAVSSSPKTLAEKRSRTEEQSPLLQQYRTIMKTSPVDEVLALHSKLMDDPSSRTFSSDSVNLIERLLDEKRLSDAIDVVKKVKNLRGRSFARFNTLRRLLAQLADVGDLDAILYFKTQSPVNEQFVFGQNLCKAAFQSNRVEECLALFEKNAQEADTSSPEGMRTFSVSFPKPGMLNLLNKDESLLPKIEDLAEKYKARGAFSGSATLWAYHFAKQNTEKASQLKEELKAAGELLPHTALCALMRDTQDLSLAPRILQEIQDSTDLSLPGASGAVHSTWIDVHCLKQQPKQGLQVLESFLQRGDIKSIGRGTLIGLSASLARENIPFPYTIPGQNKKTKPESSSSSSSDSD